MKAMILAAGAGRRMRPLTDKTPKPLLTVGGRPLIEHHIHRLREAGFTELVVNVSYLGDQLVDFLGDGSRWGVTILCSREPVPLETAGGIIKALPLLGAAPFLVVNGDIYTEYPFSQLQAIEPPTSGAHLIMVPNPMHHPAGDFLLCDNVLSTLTSARSPLGIDDVADEAPLKDSTAVETVVTYSGIGVYDPALFAGRGEDKQPLKPFLDSAIARRALSGELYTGTWEDVGTPERLAALNERFPSRSAST